MLAGTLLPAAQLRAQRVAAQHATGPYELTGCPSHTFWRDATFPTELEPDRRCGLSVEDCQKSLDELRRRDSGMRGRSTRNF